ncbi:alpha/beta fold hydrolase [Chromohalobacter nigrandesensis]|uniref:alpha/beta fold hydrolase n=1 Tax=Chromohalobacter nigrandesensis TaxID=119863 RepID=UPI001FF3FBF4|nr:alpha/beta hydrolase [Chromohalobacter nigrandesensis]MCK0746084.1 alpha/beta hydrolase [Chromohalobacter nigrandesensis]
MFDSFRSFDIDVDDDVTIHGVIGGRGPPLLLLHGHPQTHVIWHRLAPRLADHFTVVATDLRGYGDSSKPYGDDEHVAYSKRTMSLDQVRVMQTFGIESFFICGHDRGGRVAHRLALDYPDRVRKLMTLDIAPTLAMYEQTDLAFATAYWHWFFLIQPSPLPESWIEAAPKDYVTRIMGRRHAGLAQFDPRAIAEYQRCLALPGAAHGLCEDYRASRTIDLEHDRADRDTGRHLSVPLKVLWGEFGTIERCFDALAEWHAVSNNSVVGSALNCGHYLPEEAPDAVFQQLIDFMR